MATTPNERRCFSAAQINEVSRLLLSGDFGEDVEAFALRLRPDGLADVFVNDERADYAMDEDGNPVSIGDDGQVL